MHGNNEHCLAAVRVFPDSVHLKGEHGNCRAACAFPMIPLSPLTPPLKHTGGQVLISSNFQLPLLPRWEQRGRLTEAPVEVISLRVLNFLAHPLQSNF